MNPSATIDKVLRLIKAVLIVSMLVVGSMVFIAAFPL